MVNLLLSKGANINAFDKKDGRALHWAAFMGKSVLCVRFAFVKCNNNETRQSFLQWRVLRL